MKKITLLLLVSLTAVTGIKAQNFYNFTVEQQSYADLENTTSINDGQVWDYDTFGEFTMPFAFSIKGQAVNRFLFDDDYFVLLTPGADYDMSDEGLYFLSTSSIYTQDRTYSTKVSTSPISYNVSGAEGNRILKFEMKNAGLETAEDYGFDENEFYLSYQIWLYEADNAIEFHYGDNNITDVSMATDGEPLLAGFGDYNSLNVVLGQVSNPLYGEYTENTFPLNSTLSDYPSNGTVYRFAPSGTASSPDFTIAKLTVYPNPATNILTLKQDNFTEGAYTITDMTGKTIMQNKVSANNTQINVESLTSGVYFLHIENQHIKFIKK